MLVYYGVWDRAKDKPWWSALMPEHHAPEKQQFWKHCIHKQAFQILSNGQCFQMPHVVSSCWPLRRRKGSVDRLICSIFCDISVFLSMRRLVVGKLISRDHILNIPPIVFRGSHPQPKKYIISKFPFVFLSALDCHTFAFLIQHVPAQ